MHLVIFLMILFYFNYKKYKNWLNPSSLMLGLWGVILTVYELKIIELNRINSSTYIVLYVGIIFFILGTLIANRIRFSLNKDNELKKESIYIPKYNWILFLAFISILIYLPDTISSIKLLISGGNFVILRSKVNETVISNILVNLLRNYIIQPFIIFLYPMSAYCLISLKENKISKIKNAKKYIFIFSSILAIMQLFTSGGRFSVAYLLVYIIVVFRLLDGKIMISKKLKIVIGICILSVIIGIYYISVSRGIDKVGESMILYLCGGVSLLDYYVNDIIMTGYYTYGGAFLYGGLNLFFTLLGNVGFDEPQFMEYLLNQLYIEGNVVVGPSIKMNAFVSWFFYFFKDGGYIALIIESMLYGIFAQAFYKNIIQRIKGRVRINIRKLIIYAIITNTIIFSMVRFQFINYHYFLAIILTYILIKKINSKIIK